MKRRNFLTTIAATMGASVVLPQFNFTKAAENPEFVGVLVDTTRCLGCRMCEFICAETHGLTEPAEDDDKVFNMVNRKPTEKQWTIIGRYETEKGEIYVKKQCLHCNQPACVSACLTKAMHKTKDGPVVWNEDKCMGCRFCMISCPFDIPKFEYNSAVPKIQKCQLCYEKLKEGEIPACVENCPGEALLFGKRRELIRIARERIYSDSEKYVNYIYGEHDAGGTGWLYISSVPFEQLGFRNDLGSEPYPELTKEFLYGVPIILTLWPAFLLGLSRATKQEGKEKEERE